MNTKFEAAKGEAVGFCEDTALSLAERTLSTEIDEQLAEDVIQYAQRLYSLYTAPQSSPEVMTDKLNKHWDFVEDAIGSIKKASKVQSTVSDFVNPDGVFMRSAYKVESYLVDALALLIDDKDGWLDWFVYENDFGEKALESGFKGNMKPIKTTDDLRSLIELEA